MAFLARGIAHSGTSFCMGILSCARDGEHIPAAQMLTVAQRTELWSGLSSLFPSMLTCCKDKP